MKTFLAQLFEKVMAGELITREEAVRLSRIKKPALLFSLFHYAHQIRLRYKKNRVNLCGVINIKSGLCGEDCVFCAQSSRHRARIKRYPLLSPEKILEQAEFICKGYLNHLGLVASGRRIKTAKEIKQISQAIQKIKEKFKVKRCASLGQLDEKTARILHQAGLSMYHHNLETAESFFPQICSTHSFQERVETIKAAQRVGLKVCAGGIFGLGENFHHRIELAFTLRELKVNSVPLNFLHPIKGTPMEGKKPLPPLEILKIIALYRFILPQQEIKVCGGREVNLRSLQPLIFLAGANGFLIGNYLTTKGQAPQLDLEMIKDLEMEIYQ
jgi:biotin synthase